MAVEGDVRNKAKTVQQMVGELDEKKVRLQAAPSLPSSCALSTLLHGMHAEGSHVCMTDSGLQQEHKSNSIEARITGCPPPGFLKHTLKVLLVFA